MSLTVRGPTPISPVTIRIVRENGTESIAEATLSSVPLKVRALLEQDNVQSVAIGFETQTTIYQKNLRVSPTRQ